MLTDVNDFLATVASTTSLKVLSQQMIQRQLEEAPHLADSEPIFELLAASSTANAAAVLQILKPGPFQGRITAPTDALAHAHQLAQHGIPVSDLLRAYRIGHDEFQRRMNLAIAGASNDAALVSAAEVRLSAICFSYVDRVCEQIVAAYPLEQDRASANDLALRTASVMSVLSTETPPTAEVERLTSYSFDQTHVAVVIWTTDPPYFPNRITRLQEVVGALCVELGCTAPPLIIAPDDSTIWAWLPYSLMDAPALDTISTPPGDLTKIAVGEPMTGAEGFRLTHLQARQAQLVSLAARTTHTSPITLFAEIGILGLLCGDMVALRRWVQHVLDDLSIDDVPMRRLRDTLSTFLASGPSYTVAGETLNLHKNTVQYRVRKAEELCGRSVRDSRLDIETALLACQLLGQAVLRQAVAAK